jgi:adenylate kinase
LRQLLGITGSPATGKKTVAPNVASGLSLPLIDLNALARGGSRPGTTTTSTTTTTRRRSVEVDTSRLRKKLLGLHPSRAVVFGHLLPHVFRKGELDFVAVLRCEPSVLKKRLIKRGYTGQKLLENLEAELIGVLLDESLRAFGDTDVHEYDSTTADPLRLARSIVSDSRTASRSKRSDWIDWTARYTSSAKLRSLFSLRSTDVAST